MNPNYVSLSGEGSNKIFGGLNFFEKLFRNLAFNFWKSWRETNSFAIRILKKILNTRQIL